MFALYDSSRRRIVLSAFLALCVLPTVAVLALGVARHMPGHLRWHAQRLSWQLGEKVSLSRVRHPRPGVVVYEGLELLDPETRRAILRCPALEARWDESADAKGQLRCCLVLSAEQAEVDADTLDRLWLLVVGVLSGRVGPPECDVHLAARQARLQHGESVLAIEQVQGRFERLSGGSQAHIAFGLDGVQTTDPVQIRIARNHQTRPPAMGLGIHTGGASLPCSLLGLALSDLRALGPQSRFNGYVWATRSAEGWGGEVVGQFSGVDLEGLVSGRFPHTLSGAAEVTLQRALFRQGRLEEARGTFSAGPGVISRSLVDAAAERLGMASALVPDSATQLVSYDRLAAHFLVDSRGLQLRGACPPAGSGAVLAGRYGVLLSEPHSPMLPAAALVQTLVPAGAVQIPATPGAEWLTRHLPLPEPAAPRMAEAAAAGPR